MAEPRPATAHRIFIERFLIAVAILAVALLLWRMREILLLVFGAVMIAVILGIIARPLHHRLHIPEWLALLISTLLLGGVITLAVLLFGAEVAGQTAALERSLPAAWQALQNRLEPFGLAEPLRDLARAEGLSAQIRGFALSIGSGLADAALVLIGGVYLAAQPGLYRTGLIKLVPESGRALAAVALDDSAKALRLWLMGRMVSMAFVAIFVGVGMSLLGVPAPLTLALIAGLFEFVPYIGPFFSAVPAVLLAVAIRPELALWTALVYFVAQQIEGNIVDPIVQQRAVTIPPVLLLFSLAAGASIFGVPGIILAAPLTIVLFVMVKRLYVREALHTKTSLPTEKR